jgi:chitin disaccharide deacetylase
VRRLIVNADDFGIASGVNRGVVEGHQRGVVTSATLMACGARFDEAVAWAARTQKLSIGCHVVLVDGSPTLPAAKVSSLAVPNSGLELRFRESLVSFALLAATGQLDQQQIEAEITAQVQKLQAAGISVSHLDSHKHTHMFPVVLKSMLGAARKCGVRAIRNPFEPLIFANMRHWKRQFQLRILRGYRATFRKELAESAMFTPDGCIGMAATGGLTLATFQALIENLPEGTWEFVSHPGYNDADLNQVKTRLRDSRERELAILTSDEVKQLLHSQGVDLISYRDLTATQGNCLANGVDSFQRLIT